MGMLAFISRRMANLRQRVDLDPVDVAPPGHADFDEAGTPVDTLGDAYSATPDWMLALCAT